MHTMLKKDFWYDLPKEYIAQQPVSPRDAARLMVLDRSSDRIEHKIFHDLPDLLEPGDLLVVNNSKVLPARIVGVKQPTGAVCELLLLRQVKGDQWECLAKPGKRMQPGTQVRFGDGTLNAVVDETLEDGNKLVTFYYDTETLYEKLDEFGKMPLPPYFMKSWTSLEKCRCRPTSPSSWRTKVSIRRYTPKSWAVRLLPPPGCILPRS